MPDAATFGLFVVASLAVYVSPGPDMLYIASRSIGQGTKVGMLSACGTTAGLFVHTVMAAFGLSAVFAYSPLAFEIVKWLGVAYLVYLGIRTLTSKDAHPEALATGPKGTARRAFTQGAVINLLNPKIALFFLAFLPQFADPARGDVPTQMALLGLLFTVGGFVWTQVLAFGFGRAGGWLMRRPRVWAWQRRFTGSVMLALAFNLALTERR